MYLVRKFCADSSLQLDATYKDQTTGRTRLRPKLSFLLIYQGQVAHWCLLCKIRIIRAAQLKNTAIMSSPAALSRVKAVAVRKQDKKKPKPERGAVQRASTQARSPLNRTYGSMPQLDEFSQVSILDDSKLDQTSVMEPIEFDDSLDELFAASPIRSASKKRRL